MVCPERDGQRHVLVGRASKWPLTKIVPGRSAPSPSSTRVSVTPFERSWKRELHLAGGLGPRGSFDGGPQGVQSVMGGSGSTRNRRDRDVALKRVGVGIGAGALVATVPLPPAARIHQESAFPARGGRSCGYDPEFRLAPEPPAAVTRVPLTPAAGTGGKLKTVVEDAVNRSRPSARCPRRLADQARAMGRRRLETASPGSGCPARRYCRQRGWTGQALKGGPSHRAADCAGIQHVLGGVVAAVHARQHEVRGGGCRPARRKAPLLSTQIGGRALGGEAAGAKLGDHGGMERRKWQCPTPDLHRRRGRTVLGPRPSAPRSRPRWPTENP